MKIIHQILNEKKEEKRYVEERGLSNEPEIYNNYFEGDKVVNIRSKDEFHRIIDWRWNATMKSIRRRLKDIR